MHVIVNSVVIDYLLRVLSCDMSVFYVAVPLIQFSSPFGETIRATKSYLLATHTVPSSVKSQASHSRSVLHGRDYLVDLKTPQFHF